MTKLSKGTGFAQLFKKYRLRSEIETLSEFGDLLAEEGMIYETSLFTRWQKGDRIPRERKVVMAILTVFMKQKGIVSIEEANKLIEAANQRDLNFEETTLLSKYITSTTTETLPAKPYLFIGKIELLKDISWALINRKKVMLYGMPGVGKTYASIYIAHQLHSLFSDGIYWFRADIKEKNVILDDLLTAFGQNPQIFRDSDQKVEKLTQILEDRKVLVLLDNVTDSSRDTITMFLPLPLTLLVTSVEQYEDERLYVSKVDVFSVDEFLQMSEEILGKPFVEINREKIIKIGREVGFLPISTAISLKQIYAEPTSLEEYVQKIQDRRFDLSNAVYDSKNLYATIGVACKRLKSDIKQTLISCAVFDGPDFESETIAGMTGASKLRVKNHLSKLVQLSLIELSSNQRYRIHPAIKEYSMKYVHNEEYSKLAQYYIHKLSRISKGSDRYIQYFQWEYENILGILIKSYKLGNYSAVTALWPQISTYVFYSGNWDVFIQYDSSIQHSYLEMNDQRGLALYLIEDLGRIYFFRHRYEKVKKLIERAKKIALTNNDGELAGLVWQKIGAMYMTQKQYRLAAKYLSKTITALAGSSWNDQVAKSYAYLAYAMVNLNQNIEAGNCVQKSLKLCRSLEDLSVVGYIYSYLGKSCIKLKDLSQAQKLFELSYKYSSKRNTLIGKAVALDGLGRVFIEQNQHEKGQKYLVRAEKIYRSLGMSLSKE